MGLINDGGLVQQGTCKLRYVVFYLLGAATTIPSSNFPTLNVGPMLDFWKNPMLDFWKKIQHWTLMLAEHKHKHICPTCNVTVQLMLGFYVYVIFNLKVETT